MLPVGANSRLGMIDLNCDLGEGEPAIRTRALMGLVTSANVACGGHAGDARSMDFCVRLAGRHSVRIGAHPGLPGGFGRTEARVTSRDLQLLVLHQVSALATIARRQSQDLHHVKLHGHLYHATEGDPRLARAYVETIRCWFADLLIVALAGGRVVTLARESGVPVWEEGFADRGYRDDGSLVPRNEPGAVITGLKTVRQRLREMRAGQGIESVSGKRLPLRPETCCVHSDTPDALRLARTAAAVLLGSRR